MYFVNLIKTFLKRERLSCASYANLYQIGGTNALIYMSAFKYLPSTSTHPLLSVV